MELALAETAPWSAAKGSTRENNTVKASTIKAGRNGWRCRFWVVGICRMDVFRMLSCFVSNRVRKSPRLYDSYVSSWPFVFPVCSYAKASITIMSLIGQSSNIWVVSPHLYDRLLKRCWLGKRCSGRDGYWATFYICTSADVQIDWKIGTMARGARDRDTG